MIDDQNCKQKITLAEIPCLSKPIPDLGLGPVIAIDWVMDHDIKMEKMSREKAQKLLAPKPRKKSVSQRIQERKNPKQKFKGVKK